MRYDGTVPPVKAPIQPKNPAPRVKEKTPRTTAKESKATLPKEGSFVEIVISLAVCAVGFWGLIQWFVYDASDQDLRFNATLPTILFYVGESEETSTENYAIVSVPTKETGADGTKRRDLKCNLTRAQYNHIVDNWVWVGEQRYARWLIWRSKFPAALNCDYMPQKKWSLKQGVAPETAKKAFDASFQFGLRKHDADAAKR